MQQAYARWAPVYDVLCGPIFLPGRRAAAAAARRIGGRILELGVGTGLSFDDYDGGVEIVGSEAELVERRKVKPFGIYTLVCFRRTNEAA